MRYYPMGLKIEGWGCLIVGGGNVALRKARPLHQAGARLVVVAPGITAGFEELSGIERRPRRFEERDLEDVFIAVAATDDPELNRHVAEECEARGILHNVADAPDLCQFVVPAIVERGELVVSISTGGASPAFAARLRQKLEDWLPDGLEAYILFLEKARKETKTRIEDQETRRQLGEYLASSEGYAYYERLSENARAEWLEKLMRDPSQMGAKQ